MPMPSLIFSEGKEIDKIHRDIQSLRTILEQSPSFLWFSKHPLIKDQQRIVLLEKLFKSRLHPLIFRFLCFLEAKKRLDQLSAICEYFQQRYDQLKNVLKARIISACPFEKVQQHELIDRLQKRFEKTIAARFDIDPALLGGFSIQVADRIIDSSIATRLNLLKQAIATGKT